MFPQELVVDWVRVWQKPQDLTSILFDGMDHADPSPTAGSCSMAAVAAAFPRVPSFRPQDGCGASLSVGYGGPNGYIGGFGRTFPIDLSGKTDFQFWINPDANQRYTLEVNLQEDDNGDNVTDEEFQYNFVVSRPAPARSRAAAGRRCRSRCRASSTTTACSRRQRRARSGQHAEGRQRPAGERRDGDHQPGGGNQTFRTDYWNFRNTTALDVEDDVPSPRPLSAAAPNRSASSTTLRFTSCRASGTP